MKKYKNDRRTLTNSDAESISAGSKEESHVSKNKLARGYLRLLINIILLAAAVWAVFSFIFAINIAKGIEMYPAVKDGDVLLSYRLEKEYVRGDVVMYYSGSQLKCGRIIAVGGDTVSINENGTLLVNNTAQTEEIVFPTYPVDEKEINLQLENDTYYILGDYRTKANDSRTFGAVNIEQIHSKVISVFRRRGI